jgi:CheY-like chemotaxis protein
VLEAGNGLEAQTIWKQHQEKIALLFTDMVMPGTMTGLDLAERLRKEKSSLKVIISSGYGSDLKGSPPNSGLGNCLSGQTVSGNRLGEGGAGLSRPGLRSRYATRSRPSGIQNEREDFAR